MTLFTALNWHSENGNELHVYCVSHSSSQVPNQHLIVQRLRDHDGRARILPTEPSGAGPVTLKTGQSGIFSIDDIRHQLIKRVAASKVEGAGIDDNVGFYQSLFAAPQCRPLFSRVLTTSHKTKVISGPSQMVRLTTDPR